MYYAKKVYKNHTFTGCITDPDIVKNDFKSDINNFIPVHLANNGSNRIFVTFINGDTMIFYELPLNYKF